MSENRALIRIVSRLSDGVRIAHREAFGNPRHHFLVRQSFFVVEEKATGIELA